MRRLLARLDRCLRRLRDARGRDVRVYFLTTFTPLCDGDGGLTRRIDGGRTSIAPVLFGENVFKDGLDSGLGLIGDVGVNVVDGGVSNRPVEAVDKVVEGAENVRFV